MEGVTQMAKPLLWPTRSHPRASYMSAGASWPRRRRRAGARRAGGRASQSRRPTPPPTAPPAPNGAGPGGWGGERQTPSSAPLPLLAASRPAGPWGLSPPGRCTPLRGGDARIEGVPPGSAGMRRGGAERRWSAGRARRWGRPRRVLPRRRAGTFSAAAGMPGAGNRHRGDKDAKIP